MSSRRSLRVLALAGADGRWIADDERRLPLAGLADASCLSLPAEALRGRAVLLRTRRQLPTVLAAVELDGIARRLVLCPPDVAPAHLPSIIADAGIDAVVADHTESDCPPLGLRVHAEATVHPAPAPADRDIPTEWVLLTSGTTGRPKLVQHDLSSLTGPASSPSAGIPPVWSTYYDVRRYGGLAILMRALLGGSLVLSQAAEPVGAFLQRMHRDGVTHVTGTPSHWRRALMSPHGPTLAPTYVRLSGEIADQPLLDRLRAAYPDAAIVHAFATTEAGLGFEVPDGRTGFPAAWLDQLGPVALRLRDGTLQIRSARTATSYLGPAAVPLRDAEGFVDTGDLVAQSGDRCHFVGRREGVINVGGQKVHPEEVEAVINRHPAVRASRVWARASPITGAIVAAEIVLHPSSPDACDDFAATSAEILAACRRALDPYKVPASLRRVDALEIAASGKLVRRA